MLVCDYVISWRNILEIESYIHLAIRSRRGLRRRCRRLESSVLCHHSLESNTNSFDDSEEDGAADCTVAHWSPATSNSEWPSLYIVNCLLVWFMDGRGPYCEETRNNGVPRILFSSDSRQVNDDFSPFPKCLLTLLLYSHMLRINLPRRQNFLLILAPSPSLQWVRLFFSRRMDLLLLARKLKGRVCYYLFLQWSVSIISMS
jgi:hypothetical protein